MPTIAELIARVGGPRRALMLGAGLVVAALIFAASRAASAPTWVPAVANVPLENTAALTARLDAAGIPYRLARGGTEIEVADDDMARARVTLAKDGLPGGSRPGLELFDRPTWGWNEFTQRVNYRRALEGELERTIGHMRGIERAEVHIALPEDASFRRTTGRAVTASVLVALGAGAAPSPDVIRGIGNLVSSSVDGLSADRVSIHDESGREWSERSDTSTLAGLTTQQVRLQREIERSLERKAETLLLDVVGAGNARVQVSSQVNFDRVERTTQSVDPDRQAVASEQKSEILPGRDSGSTSSNSSHTYDNTKSTEVFSGATGTIRRMTVAVLVNERRLPASGPTDTVTRFAPRDAAELARLETLVRAAVGADSARGDLVSVVSMRFDAPRVAVATEEPTPALQRVRPYVQPVITLVGLLLAFVLASRLLGTVRAAVPAARPTPALAAGEAAATAGAMALPSATGAAALDAGASRHVFRAADTEVRDRAARAVSDNPDAAARLVKAWLRDA